jgi:hypothetical protein
VNIKIKDLRDIDPIDENWNALGREHCCGVTESRWGGVRESSHWEKGLEVRESSNREEGKVRGVVGGMGSEERGDEEKSKERRNKKRKKEISYKSL